MFIFKYIIVSLIISWLIIKLIKKKYDLFAVTIFLAPFTSIYFNIGLNLSIFQIFQIFLILYMFIISIYAEKINIFNYKNINIFYFMFYSIVLTILMSIFFIENFRNMGGWFRSEGRFISQIILLVLSFSLIPIAFNYIKSINDLYKYVKIILNGMIILALLGWLQFIIYFMFNIDIFPLGLRDGVAYSGIEQNLNIFRISSLAHEPKGLSIFMVIGFFIIHIFNQFKINFYKNDTLVKLLFFITCFATLATSGIILFFITGLFYFILIKKSSILSPKKILLMCIIISLFTLIGYLFYDFLKAIIESRILNRDITSEDFDHPIQLFLIDKKEYLFFGVGLGNIHNLVLNYIPLENIYYMKKIIFTAKSGYLKLISEIGIIGFLAFLLIFYKLNKNLNKIKIYHLEKNKNIINSLQLILIIILIAYLSRSYVYNELIVFIALVNVIPNLKINKDTI